MGIRMYACVCVSIVNRRRFDCSTKAIYILQTKTQVNAAKGCIQKIEMERGEEGEKKCHESHNNKMGHSKCIYYCCVLCGAVGHWSGVQFVKIFLQPQNEHHK